ncbi:MAG: hypothetical protein ACP6IY_19150 [Promethearchaeia archaeon]
MNVPEKNPAIPLGRNKNGAGSIIVDENSVELRSYLKSLKDSHSDIIERETGELRLFPFQREMLSAVFCGIRSKQLKKSPDDVEVFKGRLYNLRHTSITNF